MVLVRDLMTRNPNTVHPEMALQQALDMMYELDCRHLPVLKDGELVGIITDRDMRLAAKTPALDLDAVDPVEFRKLHVNEFMTTEPITVAPDMTVQYAAGILNQYAIGAVPVIADEVLVGILSEYDILDYVSRMPELAAIP